MSKTRKRTQAQKRRIGMEALALAAICLDWEIAFDTRKKNLQYVVLAEPKAMKKLNFDCLLKCKRAK